MPKNTENRTLTRREDWGTPLWLYHKLNQVFDFTVDLAARKDNALAPEWFGVGGIERDTLKVDLTRHLAPDEWAWCNPPYSRFVNGPWALKLMEAPRVVVLVPVSTGSRWFLPYWGADHLCWVRGRLVFQGAPCTAQFDSVLVVKGEVNGDQLQTLTSLGAVTSTVKEGGTDG